MYLAQRFVQILSVLAVRNARKVLMGEEVSSPNPSLSANISPCRWIPQRPYTLAAARRDHDSQFVLVGRARPPNRRNVLVSV